MSRPYAWSAVGAAVSVRTVYARKPLAEAIPLGLAAGASDPAATPGVLLVVFSDDVGGRTVAEALTAAEAVALAGALETAAKVAVAELGGGEDR